MYREVLSREASLGGDEDALFIIGEIRMALDKIGQAEINYVLIKYLSERALFKLIRLYNKVVKRENTKDLERSSNYTYKKPR